MKKLLIFTLLLITACSCCNIDPDDNTLDAKKKQEIIIRNGTNMIK